MNKRVFFNLAVVLILIGLFFTFYKGLFLDPREIRSPLIGKSAPPIDNYAFQNFKGKIIVLNVWSSHCEACIAEHPFLMQLKDNPHFLLVGLNNRDTTDDARNWLSENGNPYAINFFDTSQKTTIDWGIYGTPETWLVDQNGKIRYRHIGFFTPGVWQSVFEPIILQLDQKI